ARPPRDAVPTRREPVRRRRAGRRAASLPGRPVPDDGRSPGPPVRAGSFREGRGMNWTVVWLERAEGQLAAAALSARRAGESDRLNRALARLEQALRRRPNELGESRGGRSRVAVALPVTLHFEVDED